MTETNKGGRPLTVLTNEQIQDIERITAYFSTEQIVDYLGISEDPFNSIKNPNNNDLRAYSKDTRSAGDIDVSLIQKADNIFILLDDIKAILTEVIIPKLQGNNLTEDEVEAICSYFNKLPVSFYELLNCVREKGK